MADLALASMGFSSIVHERAAESREFPLVFHTILHVGVFHSIGINRQNRAILGFWIELLADCDSGRSHCFLPPEKG